MTVDFGPPEPKWEPGKIAVFLVGLKDFRTDLNRINFHDGTVLRRARPKELTYYGEKRKSLGLFGELGSPQANSSDYLIEYPLRARDFRDTAARASIFLDLLLTAMRLTRAGDVRIGDVYVFQPEVADSRHSEWWTYKGDHAYLDMGEYVLSRSDLYYLRRIHRGVWSLFSERAFDPFKRFSTGRTRLDAQDRLIDYWIALESLFSAEGESQELKYKYAVRIGHYIGADANDRYEIFGRMKEAYNVRSKVVHGKRARKLEKAEIDTEAALRASLRRAALDVRLPDLDELDRLAASGGGLR